MQLSPEKIIDILEESNAAIDETYEEFETALEEAYAELEEAYEEVEITIDDAIAAEMEKVQND